jgi:hypothetical protein
MEFIKVWGVERYVTLEPWMIEGFGNGHAELWIGLEEALDEVERLFG